MTRTARVAVLLVAALPFASGNLSAQASRRAVTETQVPSFEVWCLELQLFPVARCDSRNTAYTRAYEHYRTLAEQFSQKRAERQRREQDLIDLLNRDPFDVKH